MNYARFLSITLLVAAAAATGCDDDEMPPTPPRGGGGGGGGGGVVTPPPPPACTDLTYASFGRALFAEKCTRCHSTGGQASFASFTTRASIEANADVIIERAVEGGGAGPMPPSWDTDSTPLSAGEKALLEEWLSCGAP